ncbi:MAG: ABC transporter substrate-binding protein [Acidobacteriota bacterium]|nr:ABC transporter substrate-binding protein [Acidobacteriota bacterium]
MSIIVAKQPSARGWLALLAAAAVAACAGPAAGPRANEVVVAFENPPIHLDPRVGTDQSSARVFELVHNGLVEKRPNGDLGPELAESWEILDGGLRYRFRLRPGVRFHDGRPFSADDVVWTFQSMLDGTVVTPKRGAFDPLERVVAVAPLVVDFHMRQPYGAMLVNLTTYLGIIPAGADPDTMNDHPVGTGAFRFVSRGPDRTVLAANDEAWQGRPALDRVVLKQVPDATVRELELRKGSTHLVVNGLPPDTIAGFRADPQFRVVVDPGSNWQYLGLNLRAGPLADVAVRRAILRAIDRERIVASLWQGLGIVGESPIPPGHWAHDESLAPVPYDPPAARALLDGAGFPDPDGDGPASRFTLTYKTSTDQTAVLQAQVIQSMLAAVGIGIEIRSYEFATFYDDVKRGNYQIFSLTQTGIVDPEIFALMLHSKSVPPGGFNRGGYGNPAFDRLLELGAAPVAAGDRRPFYLEAQQIFADEVPLVSLLSKMNVAVMPAALAGYENYLSGELYSLRRARWLEPVPGAGG